MMVEGVGGGVYWRIKGVRNDYGYKGKGVRGVLELRMQGVESFARVKGRGGVLR